MAVRVCVDLNRFRKQASPAVNTGPSHARTLARTHACTHAHAGLDTDEEDHTMGETTKAKITDAAALALDLNLPDLREDLIACCLKLNIEREIGPTW